MYFSLTSETFINDGNILVRICEKQELWFCIAYFRLFCFSKSVPLQWEGKQVTPPLINLVLQ